MANTLIRTAPDISCGHCASAIRGALSALNGVERVDIDVAAKRVEVAYDGESTNSEQIDAALEAEGYPPA